MKRFGLFLFSIFICAIAYAATETINWYVDGNTYATTTCQTGGDITLPTSPTKRGYVFSGWQEIFNRGQYPEYKNVPDDISYYLDDYYGNSTPLNNDYIVIENTSDYAEDFNTEIIYSKPQSSYRCNLVFTYNNSINGVSTTRTADFALNNYNNLSGTKTFEMEFEGRKIFDVIAEQRAVYITPEEPMIINGVSVSSGVKTLLFNDYYGVKNGTLLFSPSGDFLSGKWKFVYQGIWEQDGKNGWKPLQQIN